MKNTSDILFFIWFSCLIGGPLMGYYGYHNFKFRRRLEDIPTSKTKTAAMGMIELQGYAWPCREQTIPWIQEPVCFYHLVIEKKLRKKLYRKVFRTISQDPFYLADDTGLVLIKPSVEMDFDYLLKTVRYGRELSNDIKSKMHFLLRKFSPEIKYLDLDDFKFTFNYVLPGSEVYASGIMNPLNAEQKLFEPSRGLDDFMLESHQKFLKSYAVSDNLIKKIDSPWAKKTAGRSVSDLLSSKPAKDIWTKCYGLLSSKNQKKLFIARGWEQSLLKNKKDSLGLIFGGAALFTIAIIPILFYFLK